MSESPIFEPSRPTIEEIKKLLDAHLREQRSLPESARVRDLGTENALVHDYSGRVVYELIQNALDRADRHILVRWRPDLSGGGALVVGNDGLAVSAYERPMEQSQRISDLHSLLSLHSSTKNAEESVGNKGVGFRSVFASSPDVEVFSRAADDQWWGIKLQHPTKVTPSPDVTWTENTAASFYGPTLMDAPPSDIDQKMTTVIYLKCVRAEKAGPIVETIRQLKSLPMAFLARRARRPEGGLCLSLDDGVDGTKDVPIALDPSWEAGHAEEINIRVPPEVKEETGLDLASAQVRVLLPPVSSLVQSHQDALYWSYLPTEKPTGHGVHIHGDFYLSSSRRSVDFRALTAVEGKNAGTPPMDPPGWNTWLLEKAAALIVEKLWAKPEVHLRSDFWRLANPTTCSCQYLRRAVVVRVLTDPERFKNLLSASFSTNLLTSDWTVRRYQDFFETLEAWVHDAYQLKDSSVQLRDMAKLVDGGLKYKWQWRAYLLRLVQESAAAVIPIVDSLEQDYANRVYRACPLSPPQGAVNERKVHIFYRNKPGFTLPEALAAQDLMVTAYRPPFIDNNSQKIFGIEDFSRPNLLSQIQPGADEEQHSALLNTVLEIAAEEPESGGRDSILARGPGLTPRHWLPYWRFTIPEQNLRKVGVALSQLFVPVQDGVWAPAGSVVRRRTWPGSRILDEDRLSAICRQAAADRDIEEPLEAICGLLGVGGVPIEPGTDKLPLIDGWEEILAGPHECLSQASRTILERWPAELGPLVGHESGANIKRQLLDHAWLTSDLDEKTLGGELKAGKTGDFPFRPDEVWWQDPSRGVRTNLLPRVEGTDDQVAWMRDLGIGRIEKEDRERSLKARDALISLHRAMPEPISETYDLELTYKALIDALSDDTPQLQSTPVLVRRYRQNATVSMGWRLPEESVWHDSGKASHALTAFADFSLWVVRRASISIARLLDILEFFPPAPEIERHGSNDPEIAWRLEGALWRALPDLFVAARTSSITTQFDAEHALVLLKELSCSHSEDAWLTYSFDNKRGELGKGEGGEVLLVPAIFPEPAQLLVDGTASQPLLLAEAARPLSEYLCGNNAYVDTFSTGLMAWSGVDPNDEEIPASVRRFRRSRHISDQEVDLWKERLSTSRLKPEQYERWQQLVEDALALFGKVDRQNIRPGRPITLDAWVNDESLHHEATEENVAGALRVAFERTQDFDPAVRPRVSFVEYHEHHYRTLLEVPSGIHCIALAASLHDPSTWSEDFLEELRAVRTKEPGESERMAFRHLWCDYDDLIQQRFGLPAGKALDLKQIDPAALAYANGEIPLVAPPAAEVTPGRLASCEGIAGNRVREPLSDDQWLQREKRKAASGARAESAVLRLACDGAISWLQADAQSFWEAVHTALKPLLEAHQTQALLEAAQRNPCRESLQNLLKVSNYAGNAGFDVLFPKTDEGKIYRVEVKRVSAINGAEFFLSENERQKALGMDDDWKLWLVSNGHASRDVTWVRKNLEDTREQIRAILSCGMQPVDWRIRLE